MSDTEYAKILNFYYRNYNKCPNCHKNIKDDSKDVINIKCSECGYVINITLSEYINLYQKLFEISIDKSKILTEINNLIDLVDNIKDRQKKFATLKSEYLAIDLDTNKLKGILKVQTAKLEEMKAEKFIIFNDLLEIYFQRKSVFDNIKTPITNTNKDILIEVYKNEGEVKDKRLKELVKQTKMTEGDVKNWLKWFDLVVQYGKKNKALNDLVTKINTTEMEYRQNNYNYLVKPYTIKEFKSNLAKKKLDSKAKKITPYNVIKSPAPAPPPPKPEPVVKKIIKVVPTIPQVIKKPAPPPVRKPVVLKKRVGGGSDLTGKTITIDPYSMSMTWNGLEGLDHIDIEKI